MAMQITFTHPDTGATYPNCYVRLNDLGLDFGARVGQARLAYYVDATCRAAGKQPVHTELVALGGDDFTAYLSDAALSKVGAAAGTYVFLKKQVQFATAKDV